MKQLMVGDYLERKIWISLWDEKEGFEPAKWVQNSSILFVNGVVDLGKDEITRVLSDVIQCEPVSLYVAGENPEELFDVLLNTTEVMPMDKHIMTNVLRNEKKAGLLEDFFHSVIPGDDRWDEWNFHGIIIYDKANSNLFDSIVKLVARRWGD